MTPFLAEIIGTAALLLLGDGVVANVVLKQAKGYDSGWIVITTGWGLAVFVGVYMVASVSGAHINPAVTLGLAAAGKFAWAMVPTYILAQFIGAALGAFLVWVAYRGHFAVTEDPGAKLAVFCTAPAIRKFGDNLITEIIGTLTLVLGVLFLTAPNLGDEELGLGSLDAIPVGLLVFAIGLSLGGPTGYAINPARDLAPRLVHALLPIPGKGGSDWGYAWVPVLGPVLGGLLAAGVYLLLPA